MKYIWDANKQKFEKAEKSNYSIIDALYFMKSVTSLTPQQIFKRRKKVKKSIDLIYSSADAILLDINQQFGNNSPQEDRKQNIDTPIDFTISMLKETESSIPDGDVKKELDKIYRMLEDTNSIMSEKKIQPYGLGTLEFRIETLGKILRDYGYLLKHKEYISNGKRYEANINTVKVLLMEHLTLTQDALIKFNGDMLQNDLTNLETELRSLLISLDGKTEYYSRKRKETSL